MYEKCGFNWTSLIFIFETSWQFCKDLIAQWHTPTSTATASQIILPNNTASSLSSHHRAESVLHWHFHVHRRDGPEIEYRALSAIAEPVLSEKRRLNV
jgi:hypothetical protein